MYFSYDLRCLQLVIVIVVMIIVSFIYLFINLFVYYCFYRDDNSLLYCCYGVLHIVIVSDNDNSNSNSGNDKDNNMKFILFKFT